MMKHLNLPAWCRGMRPRDGQRRSAKPGASPSVPAGGFTLVEPLMALVVVSVLLVSTAPVIVLSVASRVRARQIELATQAARSYIDNLRSGAIDPPGTINANITPARPALGRDDRYTTCPAGTSATVPERDASGTACVRFPVGALLNNLMRPTFALTDFTNDLTRTDQGVLIDGNGDGAFRGMMDFRIQAIRTMIPQETVATPAQADAVRRRGYSLIVRVYQGNAPVGVQLGTTQVERAFSARSTSDAQRGRSNPLIVMRTEITGNSTSSDYNDAGGGSIAPGLYRP